MNLQDIRQHVVELSGRFDLIDPLYDGAYLPTQEVPLKVDFFITTGQRFLDNRIENPGSEHVFEYVLAQGDYSVKIPDLAVIKELWTADPSLILSEQVRSVLKDAPLSVTEQYGAPPFTSATPGRPLYYTSYPLRSRSAAIANADSLGRHIYILPPSDGAYTVYVRGLFFAAPLVNQTDVNWWSMNYSHTLIQAALYSMERFYRNSQGMQDHLAAIDLDLQGIDFNMADEAQADVISMKNSW